MAKTSTSSDGARREVELAEYVRLCADIRSIEASNEKLVGLGFTLISLGAVGGVAQKVDEVFFFLPIAAVGTLAFAGASYAGLYSMAGYKQFLEERINARLGETVLMWEEIARRRESRSINSFLLLAIYTVIVLAISILSYQRIEAAYVAPAGLLMGLGMIALWVTFLAGVYQMVRTKGEAYAYARRLHGKTDAAS